METAIWGKSGRCTCFFEEIGSLPRHVMPRWPVPVLMRETELEAKRNSSTVEAMRR